MAEQPSVLEHPMGVSAALSMAGAPASTTAARIGSAPLAAFLKNSRRDWSSSFFIFLSIVKQLRSDALGTPCFGAIMLLAVRCEKGVRVLLPAYPEHRLSHRLSRG